MHEQLKEGTIRAVHEFSIAEALASQVQRLAPAGTKVREVELRAGPLRGLEPEALQMCWEAVTLETPLQGSALRVDCRPWAISCSSCGRAWESPVPFVECACGNSTPTPNGTSELDLVAITVDEPDGSEAAA